MASPEQRLVTRASLVVDAIVVAAFFALMFMILRSHVPSRNPMYVSLWAGLAASCMSGVFWLAVQMFRVVLRAQRASRK